MAYSHTDKPVGTNGVFVGALDAEVEVASSTGALKEQGTLLTTATMTLTNKTLTSPKINENVAVTRTATQINLLTQGVAAGYKIARGTLTPTTASDTVVTGLATVVAAVVSLKGAPTLTHMHTAADIGNQTGTPAAGSILIKSYKPTSNLDNTPLAATSPWSAVDWIAIGT